jgi:signal transduction histidine kinase
MNIRALAQFLKDNILTSIIYFFTFASIVLFYQLTTAAKVEILYPLALCLYGYLIMMTIKGITYITFYKRLRKSINNPQYQLLPKSNMQREVSAVISELHFNYINQINTLKVDNERQKHFLTQWIHNLKTPISVINLTTQKSMSSLVEVNENIISIAEENDKLHNSVEQLLSILRLDNFEKDYNPEKIDIVKEIKKILGGQKKRFVMYNVFPEVIVQTEATTVFTDRKWHKLMLEQIILNAIKYSHSSSSEDNTDIASDNEKRSYCKIWLTLYSTEESLVLSIRDEGMGIPEYDQARIFEPFFTGDNGRKVNSSTGIGLYIVDLTAKLLGHKIEMLSKQGEGTTFFIHYLSKV